MSEVNEAASRVAAKPGHGSRFLSRKIIALVLVAVAAAVAAAGYYWYSAGRQPLQHAEERAAEPPFYLELKPFVVSIASSTGTPRFLQMGLDLALSGKGAGNAVTAILPEIQDALRQTALGFNAEEIVTPAGVDRLRQAMIVSVNRLLIQRLGAAEVKSLTDDSGSGGVGDTSGNSYAITTGGAGAFTATGATPIIIYGSSGNANLAVSAATESAQNIAASINGLQGQTGVTASADTSVAFTVTAGSISFVLGNGNDGAGAQTNAVNISATVGSVSQSGLQNLVSAINQQTGSTGVTASVNSNNQLVLTQAQGDNISITGFAGTGTLKAGGTAAVTLAQGGTTSATVQGLVTLQSNQSFSLSAAGLDIGLNTASSLSSLAGVNVSTVSGANSALNIVSFALQQLENVGAQLGAVQQRLQATVSNLQTTDTNLTTAKSVVEDANIPQVTTQLTQQQILQQAGVSALSQSNALQQSFVRLLQQL